MNILDLSFFFFFSSRRRHTRFSRDWSSDVCSSDLVRRLRRDPRVPPRAKVAIVLAGLWLVSPIDLIPEFLPVIGPLDDVVVVALALRYAGRSVPPADAAGRLAG